MTPRMKKALVYLAAMRLLNMGCLSGKRHGHHLPFSATKTIQTQRDSDFWGLLRAKVISLEELVRVRSHNKANADSIFLQNYFSRHTDVLVNMPDNADTLHCYTAETLHCETNCVSLQVVHIVTNKDFAGTLMAIFIPIQDRRF